MRAPLPPYDQSDAKDNKIQIGCEKNIKLYAVSVTCCHEKKEEEEKKQSLPEKEIKLNVC